MRICPKNKTPLWKSAIFVDVVEKGSRVMRLLAIDPGPVESAAVSYDIQAGKPLGWTKCLNEDLLAALDLAYDDRLAVEKVVSYGMSVGGETFETVYWSGRFCERWALRRPHAPEPIRIPRKDCVLHICNNPRGNDSNIRQALIDRFGPKGTKKNPGLLYGMKADCWAALAVAVTVADTQLELAA